MKLSTDEQVIEARKYLALSEYLLGNAESVDEEFTKLLYLAPDHQLDPFTIAPPIIELFESVRKKLKPDLDVIRQRKTDAELQNTPPGLVKTVEIRYVEQSEVATLLPFGAGQFQNGHVGWGLAFAGIEAGLLATNVGAYLAAVNADRRDTARTWTIVQYVSAALFGITWSLGVFHARLHFVPTIESPPVIREDVLPPPMGRSRAQFVIDGQF
jgi:hypothetical protein